MPRNNRINTGNKFKKVWDSVVYNLGRKIVIYLSDTESECPNCYYDKVNKSSSGVAKSSVGDPNYFVVGRCPVCNGKGVLTTTRKKCIYGIVVWNPAGDAMNSLTFTEAGYEGATVVEIKTDPCNLNIIENSKYALIDGVKCKLSNPPIVRGMGGKHTLVALFFTTKKSGSDSGETI